MPPHATEVTEDVDRMLIGCEVSEYIYIFFFDNRRCVSDERTVLLMSLERVDKKVT